MRRDGQDGATPGDDARERIHGYLRSQRPRGRHAARRPADRRRVGSALLPHPAARRAVDRAGAVLGRRSRSTKLPFVNVATLLAKMPVPIPAVLGHADDLGVLALQDLGDVTLQAHLGAATPAEHAALYRQAVALIATLQRRGAELASPDYLPYGIAFDVEKLTWELDFFTKHFIEAYRGVTLADDQRARAARRVRGHRPGAGGRAPGALPSRLPQPQPDAARGAALHHRLPGRAHGAGHLRSGVAAARLLRRSAGADRRRADRLFPRAQGRHRADDRSSAAGST